MAKINKYDWQIGKELPSIDNHSIVKLNIIEQYLEIYLRVLTQSHLMDSLRLTVIDGFAGGGIYQGGIKGSPLRIYETIKNTEIAINLERNNKSKKINFNIDMLFIEKSKKSFNFLKKTMNELGYKDNLHIYNGKFENFLDTIIQKIQKKSTSQKSIFILDQYGYADASIPSIKKIFSKLKKVEVILTFSVDSLIDYISRKNSKVLLNMGLSKDDCERIFDIKEDNDFARSKIQPLLYQLIVKQTGAKFYTPFFIKSDTSNRSYWLFHLSSHAKARDEMIKLHWDNQNTFQHFGKAGLKMLIGYNSEYEGNLFKFDNFARKKSIESLSEELPKIIYEFDAIEFSQLKNNIINETPATVDMIKESLREQIHYKELIIKSKEGTIRQKTNTIHDTDIITKPSHKQLRLKF